MEIVTVTCKRDINEILLQAQSIDLFVEQPTTHIVLPEDARLSCDEWYDILSPFYTRHTLKVLPTPPREDREEEFYDPWSYGWRRQEMLTFAGSEYVTSDRYLSLDSKNIFIRSVDLNDINIQHGSGRYALTSDIMTKPNLHVTRNWLLYITEQIGKKIPNKFCGGPCETPFVMNTQLSRMIYAETDFEKLFFSSEYYHAPRSEYHLYWFYVDPEDYSSPSSILLNTPSEYDYDKSIPIKDFIAKKIEVCEMVQSYTHGLHRSLRKMMDESAKDLYKNWLTYLGFDRILVEKYVG